MMMMMMKDVADRGKEDQDKIERRDRNEVVE